MGHIEVKELTEGGNVNTIHINNKGEVPVLILDGEEIQGAKQNRMVNATIMLFPVQETEVPVSCVEQGRWRYDSPVFDKSENFGYNSLRLKGRGIIGAALEHEGRLFHLSVFATAQSKNPERNRESRMERPSRRRRNLE